MHTQGSEGGTGTGVFQPPKSLRTQKKKGVVAAPKAGHSPSQTRACSNATTPALSCLPSPAPSSYPCPYNHPSMGTNGGRAGPRAGPKQRVLAGNGRFLPYRTVGVPPIPPAQLLHPWFWWVQRCLWVQEGTDCAICLGVGVSHGRCAVRRSAQPVCVVDGRPQ